VENKQSLLIIGASLLGLNDMVIFCSHRRRSVVKCGSPVKPSNCFRHFKTLVLPYHPFLTQVFTLDDVKLSVIEHEF